ncbi:hypothetical protein AB0H83_14700 [Dactylosporangium sp. NPDC050688]|uniref:WXG100-like domain-containing protein n=1 Tax=Dactylosporangium sp. NPDC050688 TaxID=3157217 RepID=UPI0033C59492
MNADDVLAELLDWFEYLGDWIPGIGGKVYEIVIGKWPKVPEVDVYALADVWGEVATMMSDASASLVTSADPITQNWRSSAAMTFFIQWNRTVAALGQVVRDMTRLQQGVQSFGNKIEMTKFNIAMNLFMLAIAVLAAIMSMLQTVGLSWTAVGAALARASTSILRQRTSLLAAAAGLVPRMAPGLATRAGLGASIMGGTNLIGQYGQIVMGNRTMLDGGDVIRSAATGAVFLAPMGGGFLGHVVGGGIGGVGASVVDNGYRWLTDPTSRNTINWLGDAGRGLLHGAVIGGAFGAIATVGRQPPSRGTTLPGDRWQRVGTDVVGGDGMRSVSRPVAELSNVREVKTSDLLRAAKRGGDGVEVTVKEPNLDHRPGNGRAEPQDGGRTGTGTGTGSGGPASGSGRAAAESGHTGTPKVLPKPDSAQLPQPDGQTGTGRPDPGSPQARVEPGEGPRPDRSASDGPVSTLDRPTTGEPVRITLIEAERPGAEAPAPAPPGGGGPRTDGGAPPTTFPGENPGHRPPGPPVPAEPTLRPGPATGEQLIPRGPVNDHWVGAPVSAVTTDTFSATLLPPLPPFIAPPALPMQPLPPHQPLTPTEPAPLTLPDSPPLTPTPPAPFAPVPPDPVLPEQPLPPDSPVAAPPVPPQPPGPPGQPTHTPPKLVPAEPDQHGPGAADPAPDGLPAPTQPGVPWLPGADRPVPFEVPLPAGPQTPGGSPVPAEVPVPGADVPPEVRVTADDIPLEVLDAGRHREEMPLPPAYGPQELPLLPGAAGNPVPLPQLRPGLIAAGPAGGTGRPSGGPGGGSPRQAGPAPSLPAVRGSGRPGAATKLIEAYEQYQNILRHNRAQDRAQQDAAETAALDALAVALVDLMDFHKDARDLLTAQLAQGLGEPRRYRDRIAEHTEMVQRLEAVADATAAAHQPRPGETGQPGQPGRVGVSRAERLAAQRRAEAAQRRAERSTEQQLPMSPNKRARVAQLGRQAHAADRGANDHRLDANRLLRPIVQELARAAEHWTEVERRREAWAADVDGRFDRMDLAELAGLLGDPDLPSNRVTELPVAIARSIVGPELWQRTGTAPQTEQWLVNAAATAIAAGLAGGVNAVARSRAVVAALVGRDTPLPPAASALLALAELWQAEGGDAADPDVGSPTAAAAVTVAAEILTADGSAGRAAAGVSKSVRDLVDAASSLIEAAAPVEVDPYLPLRPGAHSADLRPLADIADSNVVNTPELLASATAALTPLVSYLGDANAALTERSKHHTKKRAEAQKEAEKAGTAAEKARKSGDRLAETRAAEQERIQAYQEGEIARRHENRSQAYENAATTAEQAKKSVDALLDTLHRAAQPAPGRRGVTEPQLATAANDVLDLFAKYDAAVRALQPDKAALATSVPHQRLPWIDELAEAINARLREEWGVDPRDEHPELATPDKLNRMLRSEWRWTVGGGAMLQFGTGKKTVEFKVRLRPGDAVEVPAPDLNADEIMIGQIPYYAHGSNIWQHMVGGGSQTSLTVPAFGPISKLLKLFKVEAGVAPSWGHSWSQSVTGADFGMPGGVLDNRGPSTLFDLAGELDLAYRTAGTIKRNGGNAGAWQPLPLDPARQHVRTPVWLADPLADPPANMITKQGTKFTSLPEHALVGMTGLVQLYDKILDELGDRTPIGSTARAQLATIIFEVYPARVRQTAQGPVTWQISNDGKVVAEVALRTTVDSTTARVLGSRGDKLYLEWLRVGFSQAKVGHSQSWPRQIGRNAKVAVVSGRYDTSWGRSSAFNAGSEAIHPVVQRFAGANAVLEMQVNHEAEISLGKGKRTTPAAASGTVVVAAPETYTYAAGLPVAADAVRKDAGGTTIRDASGEPVLDGDLILGAPPGRKPENPSWRQRGRADGAGPALVQDLTGVEGPDPLRDQVRRKLEDAGFIRADEDHGLLDELTALRLETGYDQSFQDGVDVVVTNPAGETRILRVQAVRVSSNYLGYTHKQTLVALDIHSGGAARSAGAKLARAGGVDGSLTWDDLIGLGGGFGGGWSRSAAANTSEWLNRGVLFEAGAEGSAVFKDTFDITVSMDVNGAPSVLATSTGATAKVVLPVALLPDARPTQLPSSSPAQPADVSKADRAREALRKASIVHLDGRTRETVLAGIKKLGLTVDPHSPAFLAMSAGLNLRSLIAAGPTLFTGIGHQVDGVAFQDGQAVPITIKIQGEMGTSTVVGAGPMVRADILFGMHSVGDSAGAGWSGSGTAHGAFPLGVVGASGTLAHARNTSRSSSQIVGDEVLILELGQQVFRTAKVTFNVTVTARPGPQQPPTVAPAQVSKDHLLLYAVPEPEELDKYAAGTVSMPLDLVVDAVARYVTGDLALDRLSFLRIVQKLADDVAELPGKPRFAPTVNRLVPELSGRIARTLRQEFADQPAIRAARRNASTVDLLKVLTPLDRSGQLPPMARQGKPPAHLNHGVGQSPIYGVDLRTATGEPVADVLHEVTALFEQVASGAIDRTPGLWRALYNRFADGRWLNVLEDGMGGNLWRTDVEIVPESGHGREAVAVELGAVRLEDGEVLGIDSAIALIHQNYHYEQSNQGGSRNTSGSGEVTAGAPWPLSFKYGETSTRNRSGSASYNEQLTRLFQGASFTPVARVRRPITFTLTVSRPSTPLPGLDKAVRGAVNLIPGRNTAPRQQSATLTGTVLQLVSEDEIEWAGGPSHNPAQPVTADPTSVSLPHSLDVETVEIGPVADAIVRRLGRRDLLGRRAHEVADIVHSALRPSSYRVQLPRMSAATGHRIGKLPVPGRPKMSVDVIVRARISELVVVTERGDVRIGDIDRIEHIAEHAHGGGTAKVDSVKIGALGVELGRSRERRYDVTHTEKVGDRDETTVLYVTEGALIAVRVDHDVMFEVYRDGRRGGAPVRTVFLPGAGSGRAYMTVAKAHLSEMGRQRQGGGAWQALLADVGQPVSPGSVGPDTPRALRRMFRRLAGSSAAPLTLEQLARPALGPGGAVPGAVRTPPRVIHVEPVVDAAPAPLNPLDLGAELARETGAVVVFDVRFADGEVRRHFAMPNGRVHADGDAFGTPSRPINSLHTAYGINRPDWAAPGTDNVDAIGELARAFLADVADQLFVTPPVVRPVVGQPDGVFDVDGDGVPLRLHVGAGEFTTVVDGSAAPAPAQSVRVAGGARPEWQVRINAGIKPSLVARNLGHELREIVLRERGLAPEAAHQGGVSAEFEVTALQLNRLVAEQSGASVGSWMESLFELVTLDRAPGDAAARARNRQDVLDQVSHPEAVQRAFDLLDQVEVGWTPWQLATAARAQSGYTRLSATQDDALAPVLAARQQALDAVLDRLSLPPHEAQAARDEVLWTPPDLPADPDGPGAPAWLVAGPQTAERAADVMATAPATLAAVPDWVRRRIGEGRSPVPFLVEDGAGEQAGGPPFGIELEFNLGNGPDQRWRGAPKHVRLGAIGRDLHAAGLTRHPMQQPYHSATEPTTDVDGWRFEYDADVDGEVISPVLTDSPQAWRAVARVLEILVAHGAQITWRAGGHVHVSTALFHHDLELYRRLAERHDHFFESILRIGTNPLADRHRGLRSSEPAPHPATPEDLAWVIADRPRGSALSFANVDGGPGDHVEFRSSDGSLDPGVVQARVTLMTALVRSALRAGTEPLAPATPGSTLDPQRHLPPQRIDGWRVFDADPGDLAQLTELFDALDLRPVEELQLGALFFLNPWFGTRILEPGPPPPDPLAQPLSDLAARKGVGYPREVMVNIAGVPAVRSRLAAGNGPAAADLGGWDAYRAATGSELPAGIRGLTGQDFQELYEQLAADLAGLPEPQLRARVTQLYEAGHAEWNDAMRTPPTDTPSDNQTDTIAAAAVPRSLFRGDVRSEVTNAWRIIVRATAWRSLAEVVADLYGASGSVQRHDTAFEAFDVHLDGVRARLFLGVGDLSHPTRPVPPPAMSERLPSLSPTDIPQWSVTVSEGTDPVDIPRALTHELREIRARELSTSSEAASELSASFEAAHEEGRAGEFDDLARKVLAIPEDHPAAAEQVWPWLRAVYEFAALDMEDGIFDVERSARRRSVVPYTQHPELVIAAFALLDRGSGLESDDPDQSWQMKAVGKAVHDLAIQVRPMDALSRQIQIRAKGLAEVLKNLSWRWPATMAVAQSYLRTLPPEDRATASRSLVSHVLDTYYYPFKVTVRNAYIGQDRVVVGMDVLDREKGTTGTVVRSLLVRDDGLLTYRRETTTGPDAANFLDSFDRTVEDRLATLGVVEVRADPDSIDANSIGWAIDRPVPAPLRQRLLVEEDLLARAVAAVERGIAPDGYQGASLPELRSLLTEVREIGIALAAGAVVPLARVIQLGWRTGDGIWPPASDTPHWLGARVLAEPGWTATRLIRPSGPGPEPRLQLWRDANLLPHSTLHIDDVPGSTLRSDFLPLPNKRELAPHLRGALLDEAERARYLIRWQQAAEEHLADGKNWPTVHLDLTENEPVSIQLAVYHGTPDAPVGIQRNARRDFRINLTPRLDPRQLPALTATALRLIRAGLLDQPVLDENAWFRQELLRDWARRLPPGDTLTWPWLEAAFEVAAAATAIGDGSLPADLPAPLLRLLQDPGSLPPGQRAAWRAARKIAARAGAAQHRSREWSATRLLTERARVVSGLLRHRDLTAVQQQALAAGFLDSLHPVHRSEIGAGPHSALRTIAAVAHAGRPQAGPDPARLAEVRMAVDALPEQPELDWPWLSAAMWLAQAMTAAGLPDPHSAGWATALRGPMLRDVAPRLNAIYGEPEHPRWWDRLRQAAPLPDEQASGWLLARVVAHSADSMQYPGADIAFLHRAELLADMVRFWMAEVAKPTRHALATGFLQSLGPQQRAWLDSYPALLEYLTELASPEGTEGSS